MRRFGEDYAQICGSETVPRPMFAQPFFMFWLLPTSLLTRLPVQTLCDFATTTAFFVIVLHRVEGYQREPSWRLAAVPLFPCCVIPSNTCPHSFQQPQPLPLLRRECPELIERTTGFQFDTAFKVPQFINGLKRADAASWASYIDASTDGFEIKTLSAAAAIVE